MDLGVSSPQIDDPERGFSFMHDGPLDMRMNQDQILDARHIVNHYEETQLVEIFKDYGEERFAKRIAANICKTRALKEIETTFELSEIVKKSIPFSREKKHPATRIFQAIRIEVNQEMNELSLALPLLFDALKNKGRFAVLTFHSLEDRIIKNYFKQLTKPPVDNIPKFIPIKDEDVDQETSAINICSTTPSDYEIERNPRSRSARLRVIEKKMMKLNILLFIVLIVFCLLKVNTEHLYRKNFSILDSEQKREIELKEEKTKLELENTDQSGNNRIEEFAKKKLEMVEPNQNNIIQLEGQ